MRINLEGCRRRAKGAGRSSVLGQDGVRCVGEVKDADREAPANIFMCARHASDAGNRGRYEGNIPAPLA
jgi:hypothetical protein